MSGFFHRARVYRTRVNLLGEAMSQDDFVQEIPDEERITVLSDIDTMLKDGREGLALEVQTFTPKRRAYVFPLLLNIGALLILGIGALVMFRLFDQGESEILISNGAVSSAEGRILDRLRRESEAQLGAKDSELAGIRTLLSDLESEKALLEVETESRIFETEEALRLEFEASLASERARLADDGVSGNELSVALVAFESEMRNQFDADLLSARNEAEAEQARRIAELNEQRVEYESQIVASDAERSLIENELESRNAELEELEAQRIAEVGQVGAATRQLEQFQATRDQAKLITDQILAFYGRVGTARSADDPDTTLRLLDSLENYLTEDGIRNSAVVVERREADAFLIDALRRLVILENENPSTADTTTIVGNDGSSEILAALNTGASVGTRLSAGGNAEGARRAWLDTFSAVPELEEAFRAAIRDAENSGRSTGALAAAGLAGGAAASADELAAARSEGLAQGRSIERDLARGEIDSATDLAFASGQQKGIAESEDVITGLQGQLASLTGNIDTLFNRYSQALARNRDDVSDQQDKLIDLLESKLVIKSGLDENLYSDLDEYTDATGDYRELQSREAVYAEIVEFLSALSSNLGE